MQRTIRCSEGHVLHVPHDVHASHAICSQCGRRVSLPENSTQANAPSAPRRLRFVSQTLNRCIRQWQRRHGIRHDSSHVSSTRWFAVLVGSLAIFASVPAFVVLHVHATTGESILHTPRWIPLSFLSMTIILALSMYLWQLVDWSALWMISVALAALACVYAGMIGLSVFSQTGTVVLQKLSLVDLHARGQLTRWSFSIFSLTIIPAYLTGSSSLRWFRRYIRTHPHHASQLAGNHPSTLVR